MIGAVNTEFLDFAQIGGKRRTKRRGSGKKATKRRGKGRSKGRGRRHRTRRR